MQVVTERLLCHAIIGSKSGKTQIMQVDVTCEFIAPVLQLSSREITFRVEKVSGWVVSSCSMVGLLTCCTYQVQSLQGAKLSILRVHGALVIDLNRTIPCFLTYIMLGLPLPVRSRLSPLLERHWFLYRV